MVTKEKEHREKKAARQAFQETPSEPKRIRAFSRIRGMIVVSDASPLNVSVSGPEVKRRPRSQRTENL